MLTHEQRRSIGLKSTAVVGALLLAACCEEPVGPREETTDALDRIDSCDMRKLFGTCVEYTLSELDDDYRIIVERACPSNRRGNLVAEYRLNTRCPAENRVARCGDMVEDPSERYEYDKHYYWGTAAGFSWEPDNVRATCEHLSGHFVPE